MKEFEEFSNPLEQDYDIKTALKTEPNSSQSNVNQTMSEEDMTLESDDISNYSKEELETLKKQLTDSSDREFLESDSIDENPKNL